MASIDWSGALASGSTEIDTQHKELFQRINDLLNAQERGGMSREEVSRIVSYLSDYVVFHFGAEEKLMDTYSYSSASGHKAQHAQFIKVFQRLKDRMLHQGISADLQQETKELVVDWLLNHIKFSDRALGSALKLKHAG
ncbi:MAG: bacteriohemerythrin [Nitrospiraceae bacterium]|nr:bacteriohemerythrin [Nitrospiraceae bacterium]